MSQHTRNLISYFFIRCITASFAIMPFWLLHLLGKFFGNLAYFLLPKFRKRALSNLALAKELELSNQEIRKTCRRSFQSLCITALEYPKYARLKTLPNVTCLNPEYAESLIRNDKQGIIFFCAHQANWELLFLEGTTRMPGYAIGRPTKNPYLYRWVTKMREKFGGKMLTQKNAFFEGYKALKKGAFLGIVGDQGMPESSFYSSFLGREAYTSNIPALLSYKSNCPLIVATIYRKKRRYFIEYSDPIWPNQDLPKEEEVERMMREALSLVEESIKKFPEQWLWQHNRWKQETPKNIYYRYRYDPILILLPEKEEAFSFYLSHLKTFREIYPQAFISIVAPQKKLPQLANMEATIFPYKSKQDLLLDDYQYKLVFDFTEHPLAKKYYLKRSAFQVLTKQEIYNAAKEHHEQGDDFSLTLKKALTRPGTIWNKTQT